MNIPGLEGRRYTPTPHLGQTEELGADRTKSTPTISPRKMQYWKNTVQRPKRTEHATLTRYNKRVPTGTYYGKAFKNKLAVCT